ncbi:sugar metabolism global transcriptional regulator Mlc [Photobacterium lucens]|uniref:sugar metabolism global transcriptional regulator Mlc n=1 Tax=Photobacterium lucens TaxID=2562949 RepID=UPI0006B5D1BA|nr:ROK family protein [Photobacterium lucens]KPA52270.1 transcriptional regulator [Photobacterium leiognathi subsp. mandapamensis]MBP2701789.1 ROK family protein [Vibrio parahaemolyticus]MZG56206.1 ROK family protein [Photobacterium lucens]MZG82631.1 ROK family protein [Photobacterium lucens]PSV23689.1 ROK family protein [Photobacterium leiognathi subsp. mandapamensis]
MYVAQPGHIDHIKRNNAGSVYKLIDLYGPISRIELSKRSQLAPASITKITRELIDAHLIKETQFQESSSRGRPAIGLVPANEGWQFLSIRLGRGYLTIALHALGGEILVEERQDIEQLHQVDVVEKLLQEINVFFANHVSELDRITAIAVSLPGLVNSSDGVVLQMPHYNVSNLPLGEIIHQETGLPVFIGNDTRSWALAEKLFGNSRGIANSILVSIHHGVGAGIVLDDNVLQGKTGNVGELGHIQIKPYGKRCFCGNHGCLETVASLQAILEQVKTQLDAGHESMLSNMPLTIEAVCDAAVEGDSLARQIIIELGHNLGQAIAIMVNLFNPQRILIGGEFNRAKSVLYPAIMERIRSQTLPVYFRDLEIEQSCFYTQATMPGAALVKQAMYDGHLLMKLVDG